jgi:hypothetical protein
VIAREKQRKQLGGGTITDGETDAKNASEDGPYRVTTLCTLNRQSRPRFSASRTVLISTIGPLAQLFLLLMLLLYIH